jgi:hypothetical protein
MIYLQQSSWYFLGIIDRLHHRAAHDGKICWRIAGELVLQMRFEPPDGLPALSPSLAI